MLTIHERERNKANKGSLLGLKDGLMLYVFCYAKEGIVNGTRRELQFLPCQQLQFPAKWLMVLVCWPWEVTKPTPPVGDTSYYVGSAQSAPRAAIPFVSFKLGATYALVSQRLF
jgi:hypothetical protein